MADDLAPIRNALTERAGDLARYLIGEPTAASKRELRWGRHGSFSVVLTGKNAGVWRDHETNDAGDMLALIMRERRCDFANALKFGREFVGNHSVRPSYRSQPRRADQEQPPDATEAARRIWRESVDPRGSPVERYLASRDLPLPDELANDVLRYHGNLSFERRRAPGMVALMRDIHTNRGCAIIRTFFDDQGRKLKRMMLGPVGRAAVKLGADADVTEGLHISEGVETGVAGLVAGYRPIWALGSAGAIAKFPVLGGIDALTILGEINDGGANARAVEEVAARWHEAGREVLLVEMLAGDDLNDVWREVAS